MKKIGMTKNGNNTPKAVSAPINIFTGLLRVMLNFPSNVIVN